MTLTYQFVVKSEPYDYKGNPDSWDETEEFEYDLTIDQVREFYNSLSVEEFIDACEHAYEQQKDKEYWTTEYFTADELTENNEPDWNKIFSNKELKRQVISDLLFDDEEYFEDQMKEYFYQEAKDEFWHNR